MYIYIFFQIHKKESGRENFSKKYCLEFSKIHLKEQLKDPRSLENTKQNNANTERCTHTHLNT